MREVEKERYALLIWLQGNTHATKYILDEKRSVLRATQKIHHE
jgi:hypothetical protein